MGLFDELVRTIKEAAAEARAQAEGRQPGPTGRAPVSMQPTAADEAYRRTMLARQAQARAPASAPTAEKRVAQTAGERRQDEAKKKHAHETDLARAKAALASAAAAAERGRLLAMLRDPRTARDAFVLTEIFGKPLALRPRR